MWVWWLPSMVIMIDFSIMYVSSPMRKKTVQFQAIKTKNDNNKLKCATFCLCLCSLSVFVMFIVWIYQFVVSILKDCNWVHQLRVNNNSSNPWHGIPCCIDGGFLLFICVCDVCFFILFPLAVWMAIGCCCLPKTVFRLFHVQRTDKKEKTKCLFFFLSLSGWSIYLPFYIIGQLS